jgi:branched-chain amino acid transport system ATP-binding protein
LANDRDHSGGSGLLATRGLSVYYDQFQAVREVDFSIDAGEIVALIGANGAGKSTLLRTISGLSRPTRGEILLGGRPIHGVPAHALVEAGIAHVPEARRLFAEMSVEENLDLGALKGAARAHRERSREMVFALFPRLRERRGQLSGTLSGGEQQMVAIGRGLMAKPTLMMLDEPSLGLAPLLVAEIFDVIGRIRAEGVTVLLVEQNVSQALARADRAYVLEAGRTVQEGSGSALLRDPHVRTAYLGV